jgi:hypothetical protein
MRPGKNVPEFTLRDVSSGEVALHHYASPTRIEADVREALSGRGYYPELVNLACKRVL